MVAMFTIHTAAANVNTHTKMKELKTFAIGVLVFAPFAVALSCDNIWFQILCVLYGAMLYATRRHFAKFWREFGGIVDTMLTNVEKQYNN